MRRSAAAFCETTDTGLTRWRRCARNCYLCPLCTSPAVVTLLDSKGDGFLAPGDAANEETYILACQYCNWSTLDMDVRFNRPTKITEQLSKAYKARTTGSSSDDPAGKGSAEGKGRLMPDERFDALTDFYKEHIAGAGDAQNILGNSAYGSPANLARIMSLYGGLSHNALKKTREKPQPMREARTNEGLSTYTADDNAADDAFVERIKQFGWEGTVSESQRTSAPVNYDAKFIDELWPVAMHLRTKRGKRCRQCRQFIIRPESKINSTKYRIRIIAHNNIPRLLHRPLQAATPVQNPAFILRSDQAVKATKLQPHVAQQYVLTLRNPIFETVKVTLATSAITPGKVASKVTILCPTFRIGPAGDVWDDALSSSTVSTTPGDGSRKAAMASLVANSETDRQPEAGKIWEQTRNSTSVILEIVPGSLKPAPRIVPRAEEERGGEGLERDDDILEVPVYVRVEWKVEVPAQGDHKGKAEKEARELAYWCVLGVGRIAG